MNNITPTQHVHEAGQPVSGEASSAQNPVGTWNATSVSVASHPGLHPNSHLDFPASNSLSSLEQRSIIAVTPQQGGKSPEYVTQILQEALHEHSTAEVFTIGHDNMLHPAESFEQAEALKGETMERLGRILEEAGLHELNDPTLLLYRPPVASSLSRGEDLLTPRKVAQLLGSIENCKDDPQSLAYGFFSDVPDDKMVFRDVPDAKNFSKQDIFESALRKMLREDSQQQTNPFDGVKVIADIAEGKIEFPFHHLELSEYSEKQFSGVLAVALHNNLQAIDDKIASYNATIQQTGGGKSEQEIFYLTGKLSYLMSYKESIQSARDILNSFQEGSATGEKTKINSIVDTIKKFHQVFLLHSLSQQERVMHHNVKANCLNMQASVLRLRTAEELREHPRNNILNDCETVNKLVRQVLVAGKNKLFALNNQAVVLLSSIKEASEEDPRPEVVQGYQRSARLYGQALEAQDRITCWFPAYSTPLANALEHQAKACHWAIKEELKDHPRAEIIDNLKKSDDLFGQAIELIPKNPKLSLLVYNQASSLMQLAQEQLKVNPRIDRLDRLSAMHDFCNQALEAHNKGEFDKAMDLNQQAQQIINW